MSGASFQRAISITFARDALWADVAAKTATFAREDRDEKIARRQFPARFETFANGAQGEREESIRPGGVIYYRGAALGPALALALRKLTERAPAVKGTYRRSFMVAVGKIGLGGRPLTQQDFDPEAVSADATEGFVFSPLPFSRLLDVQVAGTRPIKVIVPPGFFADAAAAVRRAYPGLRVERLNTIRIPWVQQRGKYTGRRIDYPAIRIALN